MAEATEPDTTAVGGEAKAPAAGAAPAVEDWATRYKYLLADFENYRKRTDRERESAQTRLRADLLRSLLPIYEAFERARALASSGPGDDGLRRGLDLLESEWQRLFRDEGVEVAARVGQPFDAEEHEAVGETVADATFHEGDVAEIVQQGYRFRGGLLRPAKVIVARSPPPESGEGTPPEDPAFGDGP